MQKEKSDSSELDILKQQIQAISERLNIVESQLRAIGDNQVHAGNVTAEEEEFEIHLPFKSKGSFEFSVGEYGMAWLGNIVLLFGILFLIQYFHKNVTPFLSLVVGIVSISGIFLGAHLFRNTYSFLARLLNYNAHLILFYLVIRLHFVSENPLIQNQNIALGIIGLVLGTMLFLAVKKSMQFKSGLILIMFLVAGTVSNSEHFFLGITLFASLLSVCFYYRLAWFRLVVTIICFSYFVQLMWLLNNPIITSEPVLIETNSFAYVYLILTGFLYSLLALLPKNDKISNELLLVAIILNGIGFSSLLLLTTFTYFQNSYVYLFLGITLFCLVYALLLQAKSPVKITASFYAIYGFVAMSIVIFGIYNFPKAYLLLSVQSFLVVSMALLFRSRFLVVMNTILFLLLMTFYIKDKASFTTTDFTFVLVAFITARVMNWKKERLTLKTELIRNIYLVAGLTMTLIALYHAVPETYITISWIAASLTLFLFSRLIKNIKYRWLAIAGMITSAIHLVIADMSKMELIYRILVFLLLAIISITISIVYTKYFSKKKSREEQFN